jgi:hypothetical protein
MLEAMNPRFVTTRQAQVSDSSSFEDLTVVLT